MACTGFGGWLGWCGCRAGPLEMGWPAASVVACTGGLTLLVSGGCCGEGDARAAGDSAARGASTGAPRECPCFGSFAGCCDTAAAGAAGLSVGVSSTCRRHMHGGEQSHPARTHGRCPTLGVVKMRWGTRCVTRCVTCCASHAVRHMPCVPAGCAYRQGVRTGRVCDGCAPACSQRTGGPSPVCFVAF